MGKGWDGTGIAHSVEFWRECLRVLKPGGHLVAFGGTRTVHRLTVAVEDAGFEIRDSIGWVYFSGFPKSLDVSKALDGAAGAKREVVGTKLGLPGYADTATTGSLLRQNRSTSGAGYLEITAPTTPAAVQWSGWGTALKPAIEPAVLARKPLIGTVAANVTTHGTGALNIDGCRFAPGDPAWVGPQDAEWAAHPGVQGGGILNMQGATGYTQPFARSDGRWPANLYACPKAPRSERERGCDGLPARAGAEAVDREEGSAGTLSPRAGAGRTASAVRNFHPTVKPVRLMRWLCRLVTPPGGLVVDPFTGSGTTGIAAALEGFRFEGAEREPDYHAIAAARMAHAARWPESWADTAPGSVGEAVDWTERVERAGQARLFGGGAAK